MAKEHGRQLSSALWQLRQTGTFCDTVLIVRGQIELEAHAVVLAAASGSLCSMLQQNRSDNHRACQYYLDVIDYDVDTVAALLEFIYTGEMIALTSLNCSYKDDVMGLGAKFGITVDGYFTSSSSASQSYMNITNCHLTESTTLTHCNSKLTECHANTNEEVNSAVRTVCDIASADQSEVKFQVDSKAAGTCKAVSTNISVARTRSARVRQKQISGRKQPVMDLLLSCSNCSQTFSTHVGHSLKQTETANCPHCKHPCTEADKVLVKSEVVVKADNDCSTVDASQLRLGCNDVSASDHKQGIQRKGTLASKAVDSTGTSSRRWNQCGVCLRHCSTAAALKRHKQAHAEGSSRSPVSCQTCGKKFRGRSYLRYHEQLHDGGGHPFVCDVCGKGFICRSNLTTHRRTHTGDRPYECTICHKRFFQLCAVREHEKIHVGIKMFICDICGKQFMTQAQLYNHSRTHGGEKSFECNACKKRFYTNGDLVKHARIHADRRPFVCDVCGKGFKYSSNLHGHARIHTGSRPFSCEMCGKAFTYSSHLSRHAKMHARNTVSVEEAATTATTKDDLHSQSTIAQSSTDNVVGVTSSVPSAVLLVQPFFI